MRNKFFLIVSSFALVASFSIQSVYAMEEEPRRIESGYYRIKNQAFSMEDPAIDSLGVLVSSSKVSGNGHYVEILKDPHLFSEYSLKTTQKKDIIWKISVEENNTYTIQSISYKADRWGQGLWSHDLLCKSGSEQSPSGWWAEILTLDNQHNHAQKFLVGGDKRNDILWEFLPAEGNSYKIRNLSLKSDEDSNEGCLATAAWKSPLGFYGEILASYDKSAYYNIYEYYFGKQEGSRTDRERLILWEFEKINPSTHMDATPIERVVHELESEENFVLMTGQSFRRSLLPVFQLHKFIDENPQAIFECEYLNLYAKKIYPILPHEALKKYNAYRLTSFSAFLRYMADYGSGGPGDYYFGPLAGVLFKQFVYNQLLISSLEEPYKTSLMFLLILGGPVYNQKNLKITNFDCNPSRAELPIPQFDDRAAKCVGELFVKYYKNIKSVDFGSFGVLSPKGAATFRQFIPFMKNIKKFKVGGTDLVYDGQFDAWIPEVIIDEEFLKSL